MIAEIAAALNSTKVATDIVKGINASFSEAKLNEVKLDLQRALIEVTQALLTAQQEQTALLNRIRDLEQEIVKMKDWSAEKQRYELRDLGRGAFAYMPKAGVEPAEPPHWLCPNCFGHGRKSFLQFKGQDKRAGGGNADTSNYACDACKSAIKVSYNVNPAKMAPSVT